MSKTPLAPAETLDQVAKKIFTELHQAIISKAEDVFQGDVEAVHQMRVASRRLRAALSNFAVCCVPGNRRWMRALLGDLAGALGSIRDLDVMVAALQEHKTTLSLDERSHVSALIRRLRARRRRRRRRLEILLRSEDYARFKHEFLSVLTSDLAAGHQTDRKDDYGQGAQGEEGVAN